MEKEFLREKTVIYMMVIGFKIKYRDMVFLPDKMEINMKESG